MDFRPVTIGDLRRDGRLLEPRLHGLLASHLHRPGQAAAAGWPAGARDGGKARLFEVRGSQPTDLASDLGAARCPSVRYVIAGAMHVTCLPMTVVLGTLLLSTPVLGEAADCAAITDRSARL